MVAEYQPDGTIHAVFMAVVGGALALGRRDKNGSDGKETPPPTDGGAPGDDPSS